MHGFYKIAEGFSSNHLQKIQIKTFEKNKILTDVTSETLTQLRLNIFFPILEVHITTSQCQNAPYYVCVYSCFNKKSHYLRLTASPHEDVF